MLCASATLVPAVLRGQTVSLRAARATAPLRIDGRLDEADWARAEVTGTWTQRVPDTGSPASQRSEARVLLDGTNLYVGVRLYDSHPDSIGLQLARRDVDDTFTDWVWVGFDSYRDRRTAFAFGVSPLGVQRDGYAFNDTDFDTQWDAVWESAAQVDSLGWTAEMRIPLSQLRYIAGDSTREWGLQFLRTIARRGEESYWSPRDPNAPGDVSRFGTLSGLGALPRALPVDAIPYVRSQLATAPSDRSDPFDDPRATETAVGVDVRARLPKSLTLSASVNPDFGQVEADPAVVNLSAFEVFFPERRPFFLENFDTFRFGGTTTFNDNDSPNFFYTRRIGRPPQRRLSGANDAPAQTPILAALKLSGTTPTGWAVGMVNATTARQEGRFIRPDTTIGRAAVEPLTNSHVTRVRRLLRGGFTAIGAFGSWVARDLDDPTLAALLPSDAVVTGLDFEHAWAERRWTLSGVAARSRVSGDTAAISRLQRANYRAFQRPDADHLTFDPTRRALSGGYYALSAAKTAGRLTASVTAEQLDPGFETNDIGFQQRSDVRSVSTGMFVRQPQRTRFAQSWSTGVFSTFAANTAGDLLERRFASFNELQLRNFWSFSVEGSVETGRFDDRLLRGGPIAARPIATRLEAGIESDPRRQFIVGFGLESRTNRAGGRSDGFGVEVDWRPLPQMRLRVEPEIGFARQVDQFVTRRSDSLAVATGGQRYVFADVSIREARLNVRLDWTFSRFVSLQAFVQPFAASGRFDAYKEFLAPREFRFATYGRDAGSIVHTGDDITVDPDGAGAASAFSFSAQDFIARELRGNAVLRWELRPGSAVFLVWQQTRGAFAEGVSDLDAAGQLGELLGETPRNVFLVKVAWWLGR